MGRIQVNHIMFESFLQEPIIYRMVGVPTILLVDEVEFKVLNVKTADYRIVASSSNFVANRIKIHSVIKRSKGGLNVNAIVDVVRLFLLSLRVVKKGDINHCRAHGGAVIGFLLRIFKGTPYIFDYRGSVIEEREELSGRFNRPIRKILKFGESLLLRRASKVICVSQSMASYLFQVHGVEPVIVQNPTVPHEIVKKGELSQHFQLVFLGSATPWHEIENFRKLVERLLRLKLDLNVKVLTKDTEAFNWLKDFKNELTYEIKSVSPKDVHKELTGANLGYCLIRPSFSKSICMPVKFAEFISSGVPVIVNQGIGDLESIVKAYNLGLVLREPSDVNKISNKDINKIYSVNIGSLPKVLDWNFMKLKWLEVYEDVSDRSDKI